MTHFHSPTTWGIFDPVQTATKWLNLSKISLIFNGQCFPNQIGGSHAGPNQLGSTWRCSDILIFVLQPQPELFCLTFLFIYLYCNLIQHFLKTYLCFQSQLPIFLIFCCCSYLWFQPASPFQEEDIIRSYATRWEYRQIHIFIVSSAFSVCVALYMEKTNGINQFLKIYFVPYSIRFFATSDIW